MVQPDSVSLVFLIMSSVYSTASVPFCPAGGAKEPRQEHVSKGDPSGGEHPQLSLVGLLRAGGAEPARSGLHPVCGPGGSRKVQGDDQVMGVTYWNI